MKKIIILIFILILSSCIKIQSPNDFQWNQNNEAYVKIKLGETVNLKRPIITVLKINKESATIHAVGKSLECDDVDDDFIITKEEIQIHRLGISVHKIEEDFVTFKLKGHDSFC
ncbi:hypothetical protein HOD20_01135 [archaeon]|jgi:hypothetical protein|nr:hypothetical protein [archaeon]MBT4648085.1 hypothetical protein [archaeon]MBT6822523.1 hypothetical protein [archaeon]MBT7392524.1 hypothetical protein [archaeon]